MNDSKLVFICGHRKCGTTMFANLFDGHPRLSVFPTDISIFYGYYPQYTSADYSKSQQIERLENVIFRNLKRVFQPEVLNIADIVDIKKMRYRFFEQLNQDRLIEIDHILNTMLEAFHYVIGIDPNDRDWIILKETSLEIYALELSKLYPNSKFIQLIRDPRDNYAAIKSGVEKHYKLFGEDDKHSLFSLITRYTHGLKLSKINSEILGSEKYKILRFEDLCNNPEKTMVDLTKFLEIDYDPQLLIPSVLGRATGGNNYDGDRFFKINNRNISRWKERISDFEAKIIEFHFMSYMSDFDYHIEYETEESAKSASEFYKWSNYKYLFKDSFHTVNKDIFL